MTDNQNHSGIQDGFIEAEILETASLPSQSSAFNVYSYALNTTRGKKRIVTGKCIPRLLPLDLSAGVTIDHFKLFIVNGTCKAEFVEDFNLLQTSVRSFKLL